MTLLPAWLVGTPAAQPFDVPPSPAFLKGVKHCWVDPQPSAHQGRDARTLAFMRNAGENGLVHMPPVDQRIASLVLSPDEALKDNARCPRQHCRVTDSLLTRIGNSLSVLLLAQSQMLQPEQQSYRQASRGALLRGTVSCMVPGGYAFPG